MDIHPSLSFLPHYIAAQFPHPSASRRIQGLLAGEPLPAKGNLLTRFMRQADRQASYLPLYHPLGVVNSAAALL